MKPRYVPGRRGASVAPPHAIPASLDARLGSDNPYPLPALGEGT